MATIIQASLDQSWVKVQMEESEDKRHTKYYNRDLLERRKEQRQWCEAPAFCLRALRGQRERGLDGAEHGRRWREMGWESGRVLTTSKCMAPKEACLHHCRFPSDRLNGETSWCNGAQSEGGERVAQK
jgi:hypothetical protein